MARWACEQLHPRPSFLLFIGRHDNRWSRSSLPCTDRDVSQTWRQRIGGWTRQDAMHSQRTDTPCGLLRSRNTNGRHASLGCPDFSQRPASRQRQDNWRPITHRVIRYDGGIKSGRRNSECTYAVPIFVSLKFTTIHFSPHLTDNRTRHLPSQSFDAHFPLEQWEGCHRAQSAHRSCSLLRLNVTSRISTRHTDIPTAVPTTGT